MVGLAGALVFSVAAGLGAAALTAAIVLGIPAAIETAQDFTKSQDRKAENLNLQMQQEALDAKANQPMDIADSQVPPNILDVPLDVEGEWTPDPLNLNLEIPDVIPLRPYKEPEVQEPPPFPRYEIYLQPVREAKVDKPWEYAQAWANAAKSGGVNPLGKNFKQIETDCNPMNTKWNLLIWNDFDNDGIPNPLCYWASTTTKILFIDFYRDMNLREGTQLGHIPGYDSVFDLLEDGVCDVYDCYWWIDQNSNATIEPFETLEPFEDTVNWYRNYPKLTECHEDVCGEKDRWIGAIGTNTDGEYLVDWQVRYMVQRGR